MRAVSLVIVTASSVLVSACHEPPAQPPARATPRPLEPLERVVAIVDGGTDEDDPLYRVAPFTPSGQKAPRGATVVEIDGEPTVDPATLEGPVVLSVSADTYLVQLSRLFAALDDAGVEVWLAHPDAELAIPVTLKDEPTFRAWLDEPAPGKVRVIHRADGFELMTNMGKLPGGDPNGPTVPVRGGRFDLSTLHRGLTRLKSRFTTAPDVCFVPSFGMELAQTIRAMATATSPDGEPIFPTTCLVYPRPARPDGG